MADEVFTVDLLSTGSVTVTVSDDGSGIDTIQFQGSYTDSVEINLAWTTNSGQPTSGEGFYFSNDHVGHRLIVTGVIENAIGSIGRDFIQGNILANLILGDATDSGPGLADTLWGGSGQDSIHGGSGNDGILGDNDDDQLFGDAGDDTVDGGAGLDTVDGGAGADSLSGGASNGDTLSYAGSSAGIQIGLQFGTTTTGSGGDAQGDRVTGFTNVVGSAFDDRIENLDKGTIAFGQNDNLFSGGAGRDRLILGGGSDTGLGGAGNDTILGEVGDDALEGGNSNDELRGGKGQDTLTGDNGADDFVFRTINDSTVDEAQRDTLTDFSSAEGDRIDLRAIDAEAGVPGNQDFHLVTRFHGVVGELRTTVQGSNLIVSGDINGDRNADFAILVLSVTSLTATDFAL